MTKTNRRSHTTVGAGRRKHFIFPRNRPLLDSLKAAVEGPFEKYLHFDSFNLRQLLFDTTAGRCIVVSDKRLLLEQKNVFFPSHVEWNKNYSIKSQ